jgi:hypothetical protein
MPQRKRYRCRYCGHDLPAARPVTQEPNGAMLLNWCIREPSIRI